MNSSFARNAILASLGAATIVLGAGISTIRGSAQETNSAFATQGAQSAGLHRWAGQADKKDSSAAVSAVAAKGRSRLIVQVAASPSNNASGTDDVAAMRSAQDLVVSTLPATANVVARLTRLPIVVVDVDEAAARDLAASPHVVAMMEDRLADFSLDESIPLIGAPAVYSEGVTGKGWSVAILDTGVDTRHSFFGGRVVAEACFSTTDEADGWSTLCPNGEGSQVGPGSVSGCPLGVSGCTHGTHVAGIAAGDGSGGSGVARGANIVAIQVFSMVRADGKSSVRSWTSDQIRAMEWVLEHKDEYKIAAVNMSLGGGRYTTQDACDSDNLPVKAIIDRLNEANVAVVMSAGNESYTDSLGAPGCISSGIAIGSTTKDDRISSFSNSNSMLDLLAPGDQIVSSVPGNKWGTMSGTSMAAPHVAGAFTLLRSARPNATVAQIRQALASTGVPITDSRNGLARPRIQLDRALTALVGGQPGPSPKPQPAPGRKVRNDDERNAIPLTLPSFRDEVNVTAATVGDEVPIQATAYCTEGGRPDKTVWYTFTAPSDGYLELTTEGSDYDTIISVWGGSHGAPLQWGCNDDDQWPDVLTTTIGGWVAKGTAFRIQVGALDNGGNLIFQAHFTAKGGYSSSSTSSAPVSFDGQTTSGAQGDLAIQPGPVAAKVPCGNKPARTEGKSFCAAEGSLFQK